jgi:hypothetical protein
MATEIKNCCGNCSFWKILEGQTERPLWGLCGATRSPSGGLLHRYIRPVPEKLETVELFSCPVFMPSQAAMKGNQ